MGGQHADQEPVASVGCGQFSPLAFVLLLIVLLAEFVFIPLWRVLS